MERPVGKRVTSVNPLLGALSTFEMMKDSALGKDVSGRATAMRDRMEDILVDTCVPMDTDIWETGIFRWKVEAKWIIVSQYESYEEAVEGHKQWVEYMKEEPTGSLEDIDCWNLGLNEEEK